MSVYLLLRMRIGQKSDSRIGLRKHKAEQIRLDKPGRSCLATCRHGDFLVFVDTKYDIKAYPNRWECFIWCRKSKFKILMPSLPDHPDTFLKCIIKCDEQGYHEVVFFHKGACSYIYADPFSEGWETYTYFFEGLEPIGSGKYDAAFYTLKDEKDHRLLHNNSGGGICYSRQTRHVSA